MSSKKLIVFIVTVVLLLSFVSCGDNITESSKTDISSALDSSENSVNSTTSRLSSYQFVQQTKVKIMPLGDSLTQGGQHKTSAYRAFLSTMLKDGGHNSVFVGCHNWSYDSIRDGNWYHSGFGGATVETLSSFLKDMTECDADIVLLMIGRNDNTKQISAEQTVKNIDELLVNELYKMYPGVHIFLANPPPCRVYGGGETLLINDNVMKTFLPAYREYVEQKKAAGYKIDFVEMTTETTGIVWSDFTAEDFCHPLPDGYEKIAKVWYDAIKDTVADIQKQKESEMNK